MPAWAFRRYLSLYAPYRGAGIRMSYLSPDFRIAEMQLRLRWSNQNAFGTHFGGSLYSMCNPIHVLMLVHILGSGYIVWDTEGTIRFRKPGRGVVTARFEMPRETSDEIQRQADQGQVVRPEFTIQIMDEEGDVVAEVVKTLYVRKKEPQGDQ